MFRESKVFGGYFLFFYKNLMNKKWKDTKACTAHPNGYAFQNITLGYVNLDFLNFEPWILVRSTELLKRIYH